VTAAAKSVSQSGQAGPEIHPEPVSTQRRGLRSITGQSAILFSGFAAAQFLSFARNAFIGHWLSRGDFGIAASITLTLQLCETLSDMGADRLIVQSDDGDKPDLIGSAQTFLIARGIATAMLLYVLAGPMTGFFGIPDARWAFEAIAVIPLLKGFLNLDMRRRQRQLDNAPYIAGEVVPQAIALAATIPVLMLTPDFGAVLWIALLQAIAAVATSHLVSQRPYALGFNRVYFSRLWHFGWPICLSALPLIAVYQGDRMIIGRLFGMEALAGYTAAFMITMVPGLVAAKVGHALMLPLMAEKKTDPAGFTTRVLGLGITTCVASLVYILGFALLGGLAVEWVFGANYAGLGGLVLALALMWSLRMIQAVPGMALIAVGETRPLLYAGLIRASALGLAFAAAVQDYGVVGVALAGTVGELASLTYVVWVMLRKCPIHLEAATLPSFATAWRS